MKHDRHAFVLESLRRGQRVEDDDLRRALGLRPYVRLPLWLRVLNDRERRAVAKSSVRVDRRGRTPK